MYKCLLVLFFLWCKCRVRILREIRCPIHTPQRGCLLLVKLFNNSKNLKKSKKNILELFKETWREVPRPKGRAHNNCYRNRAIWSRHIAKLCFWFSTSEVTAMKNFSMQVLFGRRERWSNSRKSPKIPPQIDMVSEFKPGIWDPKAIQFQALSLQLKFFNLKISQKNFNELTITLLRSQTFHICT